MEQFDIIHKINLLLHFHLNVVFSCLKSERMGQSHTKMSCEAILFFYVKYFSRWLDIVYRSNLMTFH